ncbi:hypothetical protein CDAR_215811 [Caerostris darwini]|uniref:Uncharacterized protein n=1 Tax=Caerostris darwini TaxID=1538125 RepID=A0AAV4M768_9ARAC|nr:hypothetical protein CDAR_215811 [Caerostris darwini]
MKLSPNCSRITCQYLQRPPYVSKDYLHYHTLFVKELPVNTSNAHHMFRKTTYNTMKYLCKNYISIHPMTTICLERLYTLPYITCEEIACQYLQWPPYVSKDYIQYHEVPVELPVNTSNGHPMFRKTTYNTMKYL